MNEYKNYTIAGLTGGILLVYGFCFPNLSSDWSFFIISRIQASMDIMDSGQLLIASFAYIARNGIIYFLLYFGAVLLASSITKNTNSLVFQSIYTMITTGSVIVLNQIYQESAALAPHLISLGILLILQSYIPKQRHYFLTYSVILLFLLTAMQCLHLIPFLSGWTFGADDIAVSLKAADSFITEDQLFTTLFFVFFTIFFIIAVIFTLLVHLFNVQITTLKKYQLQEKELEETRFALTESKVYQEIHTLVHDLKTPLVSVNGLISLIGLKYEASDDSKLKDYLNRVDHSIQKMNDMISEILYENIKKEIGIEEFLRYVVSHLALDDQKIQLDINIAKNLPYIRINKIRFARAISNLLENAIISFQGKEGKIEIDVKQVNNDILFKIKDNGPGIQEDHLLEIWKEGFTTKDSSGIGLSFVKRVVENHQGRVSVTSTAGSHTQMEIFLPVLPQEGSLTK